MPEALTPPIGPGLILSSPVVAPGEPLAAAGRGCLPGSDVALSVDGVPAGSSIADGQGVFEAPVQVGSIDVGRYQVQAACGPMLTAPVDVVLASRVGAGTATLTVIVFFLLIGLLIYRRRLLPSPSPFGERP